MLTIRWSGFVDPDPILYRFLLIVQTKLEKDEEEGGVNCKLLPGAMVDFSHQANVRNVPRFLSPGSFSPLLSTQFPSS